MIGIKNVLFGVAAMASLMAHEAKAIEVLVWADESEPIVLEMEAHGTLSELDEQLAAVSNGDESWMLVATRCCSPYPRMGYGISDQGENYGRNVAEGARDYYRPVTQEEKSYIAYIVKTLSDKNEAALLFCKGSIEAAGKKIDHIHPLKFLEVIFTDEELKTKVRNIRKKSFVWKSFRDGTADSFKDEQRVDNVHEEYLVSFVQSLGNIQYDYVIGMYQSCLLYTSPSPRDRG